MLLIGGDGELDMPFTFYAICDHIGIVNLGNKDQKALFNSKESADRELEIAKQKGFDGYVQPVHLKLAGSE